MLWASNMRFLSVFAVVILHVAAGFVGGIEKVDLNYGDNNWWAGNFFDSITRWCVPVFIMISGYFLLNNNDDTLTFFKKRVSRIFIPLVFWSIIFSLWLTLKLIVKNDLESAPLIIIKSYLLGAPYYHLWYLFMIPFLYASAPYLKTILHNSEKKFSLLFIILAFLISAINILFNYTVSLFDLNKGVNLFINNFLLYIGYFMLGGFIKKYDVSIKTKHLIAGVLIAWLITIYGSYFYTYKYFYSYLSFNTIAASIFIFFIIKNLFNYDFLGKSNELAALSFGIYLVHPIVMDILAFFGRDKILEFINPFIYVPLASFFILLTSLIISLIISKIKYLRNCI